jgi:hypothetical protein
MSYKQLRALCQLLEISVVDMAESVLRFQLELKMRELEADDRVSKASMGGMGRGVLD